MSAEFRCQFDHLAVRNGCIFAYGWCLRGDDGVVDARLDVVLADGRVARIHVETRRPREDVSLAYPASPHARHAGFMVFGGWGQSHASSAQIRFRFGSGHEEVVAIELPGEGSDGMVRRAGWGYRARRILAHVRSGRWRPLLVRAREMRRQHAGRVRADLEECAAIVQSKRVMLAVDHSMGGGANVYRDRAVAEWIGHGGTAVLLTFHVPTLSFRVEVRQEGDRVTSAGLQDLDDLRPLLSKSSLAQILLNCAVSMPSPDQVLALVQGLCQEHGAGLIVAVHDYFCVCPSPFLMDCEGAFCGVPGLERCQKCLPSHEDGYVTLAAERSMSRWRAQWGRVLAAAAEIRCFSKSSSQLLSRAYPSLGARVTVTPHPVSPLRTVRLTSGVPGRIVIGVVGFISAHKGAGVVVDLARAIERSGKDIRIIVMGSLEGDCPASVVTQTGPYQRNDLPALMERWGVQMVLMPSICPETFSFVCHEVVSMGVPLMTLDLGAQADVARSYARGRVARSSSGPALMAEVERFVAQCSASDTH